MSEVVKEFTGLELKFKMHIDSVEAMEITDTLGTVEIGSSKKRVKHLFMTDSRFNRDYKDIFRTKFIYQVKDGDTNYILLNFAFDYLAEVEIYRPEPKTGTIGLQWRNTWGLKNGEGITGKEK